MFHISFFTYHCIFFSLVHFNRKHTRTCTQVEIERTTASVRLCVCLRVSTHVCTLKPTPVMGILPFQREIIERSNLSFHTSYCRQAPLVSSLRITFYILFPPCSNAPLVQIILKYRHYKFKKDLNQLYSQKATCEKSDNVI